MYPISDHYASRFVMEALASFPAIESVRRKNRGGGLTIQTSARPSSPHRQSVRTGSPKEPSNRWWDVLKGLGRRRRKSTTSVYAADFLDVSWQLTQVERLSDDKSTEDYISTLAYDDTGDLLAAGCKDGKVFVFRREHESSRCRPDHTGSEGDLSSTSRPFRSYVTFQSHEREFDHLKSVEIDEKICKLHWLRRQNRHQFLLSTNERTVKLWRVSERIREIDEAVLTNEETRRSNFITAPLRIPRYKPAADRGVVATPRRVYFTAHGLRINSLSVNSDLETFLTADDLTINLWHVEVPHLSFNIVDSRPENMDDLSEVITAAEFHPTSCSLFAHASSKGSIRLCDMRSNALCDRHSKIFVDGSSEETRNFFSDIVCCICDLKFSFDGQYLMSRDYLNLKVWDVRVDSHPVETYPVCEPLRSRLCKLYETDQIFDKFDCAWGYNDRYIATGTYGNYFKIIDRISGQSITAAADSSSKVHRKRKTSIGGKIRLADDINADSLDFRKKCVHAVWHPNDHILTNATANCLNFFHAKQSGSDHYNQVNVYSP